MKEENDYKFSSLFKFEDNDKNKEMKYLSNLEEIDLSIIDNSRKLLFDVIPNTQFITYSGEKTSILNLLGKEQIAQSTEQNEEKSEAVSSSDDKGISEEKIDRQNLENSSNSKSEVENVAVEAKDKDLKMILDYLTENKLLQSDDSKDIYRREASKIEKEISEFAKKWAVDRQALTFYVLNFDTENKDGKQLGKTDLRNSADKTNKNKLQYLKGLNNAIKEFAARLHEEYHL